MEKKLFYVVEKTVKNIGFDQYELTGYKDITVYEIIDNQPKVFCEIEALNTSPTEAEIQIYLDENGYSDDVFEFQQL